MASRWKAISRTLARQRFPERVHMDGNDRCEEERKQLRLQPSTDDRAGLRGGADRLVSLAQAQCANRRSMEIETNGPD